MKVYSIKEVLTQYAPKCDGGELMLKHIICFSYGQRLSYFNTIKYVTEEKLKTIENNLNLYNTIGMQSHIFDFKEFCGDLYPTRNSVFLPKLTTETLVNAAVKDGKLTPNSELLDLCTGSGCVAITITKATGCHADAFDVREEAVSLARENCANLGGNVDFGILDVLTDWNLVLTKQYDVITANPPYWSLEDVKNNKKLAETSLTNDFMGGEDGLLFVREIINKAANYLKPNGLFFLEFSNRQFKIVKQLLKKDYKNFKVYYDYRKLPKVIRVTKK